MSDIRKTILEIDAEMDKYYATFGRFIDMFSNVEQRLHSLLWELSGTSIEVARVAFGDARYSQITMAISRLNRSLGREEHPLYRRAIDQLGLINSMRNDLVHIGVRPINRDGLLEWHGSNKLKALPDGGKEITVTAETIVQMGNDLTTIMACLTVVLLDFHPQVKDARELPWRELAQRPWQYKPPKQSVGGQASQGKRRGQ